MSNGKHDQGGGSFSLWKKLGKETGKVGHTICCTLYNEGYTYGTHYRMLQWHKQLFKKIRKIHG